MKSFCLRLAVFLLLGIPVLFLSPQKALAKDSYSLTWTVAATPSAVIVDTNDNIYYGGYVASHPAALDFNPIPGHAVPDNQIATTGGIFVTKINSDISTYNYSYLIEADAPLVVNGTRQTSILLTKMATDSANNIYLLGSFNGNVNFDPTTTTGVRNKDFHSSGGQRWQFLTEIGADGSYKQTYFWRNQYITLNDVAFDKDNNIYVAGTVNNTTAGDIKANLDIFSAATDQQDLPTQGDITAFYTKLDATPNTYDYSEVFTNNGSNNLELDHIALDYTSPQPNVFLYGIFSGNNINFDGTGGSDPQSSNGNNDIYLSEYHGGVSNPTYVKTYIIGGTQRESAGTIAIDHDNNIYYTGTFNGTFNSNPTGGTADNQTAGGSISDQTFLTKLTGDGVNYGYTRTWQANGLTIEDLAFQNNTMVYLTGESLTANPAINYNPTVGTPDIIPGSGINDAFITVLNSDGSYNYSYVWGGVNDEKATEAALDSSYDIYIAGSTQSLSINFDPTGETSVPNTFTGGENGYINRFSITPYTPLVQPPTDNGNNNNSSSNSNSGGPSACGGSQPSAPSIFQIWATKTNATMHFVPSQGQQNTYTISYGPYSDAETYNVSFNYSDKSGAIPYTINALNPGTVYYFKVRANNGCMPGNWSNTLSLRTAYSAGSTSKVYASSYSAPKGSSTSGGTSLGGSCTQYTVLAGDSFWSIAQKLLGAGNRYLQLWNTNKGKFPSLNSSSIIRTGWSLSVGC
jgi:hypothetical protein